MNPLFTRIKNAIFRQRRQPRRDRRNPSTMYGHYGPGYWQNRKGMKYYQAAVQFARKYEPTAEYAIDIGANITQVIHQLTWIPHRAVLDIQEISPTPEVETIRADFLTYTPKIFFDLVLCLEVLEHLEDPEPFAQKLLKSGRSIILALPYRWPHGMVRSHFQDPVDEAKIKSWMHCDPIESAIVQDKARERLVAVYRKETGRTS